MVTATDRLSSRVTALSADPSRRDGPRSTQLARELAALAAADLELDYVNSLAGLIQRSQELRSRLLGQPDTELPELYDVIVVGAGVRRGT